MRSAASTTRATRNRTRNSFSDAFIRESDLGAILHYALQTLHIEPGIFMGMRTRNDAIPEGERAFMVASCKKAIMEGETPIQIRNFSKKEGS